MWMKNSTYRSSCWINVDEPILVEALFGDDQIGDEELCQANPSHSHDLRQHCDQVWKLLSCDKCDSLHQIYIKCISSLYQVYIKFISSLYHVYINVIHFFSHKYYEQAGFVSFKPGILANMGQKQYISQNPPKQIFICPVLIIIMSWLVKIYSVGTQAGVKRRKAYFSTENCSRKTT